MCVYVCMCQGGWAKSKAIAKMPRLCIYIYVRNVLNSATDWSNYVPHSVHLLFSGQMIRNKTSEARRDEKLSSRWWECALWITASPLTPILDYGYVEEDEKKKIDEHVMVGIRGNIAHSDHYEGVCVCVEERNWSFGAGWANTFVKYQSSGRKYDSV